MFSFQLALEDSRWRQWRYSRRQAVPDSWRCGTKVIGTDTDWSAIYDCDP